MLAAVTKIESDVHRDTVRRLLRKSDVNIKGKVCTTPASCDLIASLMYHVMFRILKLL